MGKTLFPGGSVLRHTWLVSLALFWGAASSALAQQRQITGRVTTALTVVSFAGPITTGHATTATRLVLALTHVAAAAIVIPMLAARVARSARS